MVYRYAVEIRYPNGGGPGYNVWHFRAGDDTIQSCVDAIEQCYLQINGLFQPGSTIVGPAEAVGGIEGTEPTVEAVDGFSIGGAGSGTALAPVLQAVISWRTPLATRSGRGRSFFGPLASDAADAQGTLSPLALGDLQAAGQSIVAFNGELGEGAIGVWSPTDGVIRDITSFTVRDQFAVLRSRRD